MSYLHIVNDALSIKEWNCSFMIDGDNSKGKEKPREIKKGTAPKK